jgi:hypothetical protein
MKFGSRIDVSQVICSCNKQVLWYPFRTILVILWLRVYGRLHSCPGRNQWTLMPAYVRTANYYAHAQKEIGKNRVCFVLLQRALL